MKQNFTKTHVQYPYAVRNEKLLFDKINFRLLLPWQHEYALNIMAYYHDKGLDNLDCVGV